MHGGIIGLTGGMGSGKSTALALFKRKGAFVLDADAIVRDLLDKDRAVARAVRRSFGADVFDAGGRIDRKKLAGKVFTAPDCRKKLEKILHPRVRSTIWSALAKKKGRVAVLDIPLLYESKWDKKMDRVVVVDATLERRLARLKKRGFSAAESRRRIAAQMSLAEKARRADFVIDNNGSVAQTKKQIDEIWTELTGGHDGIAARA